MAILDGAGNKVVEYTYDAWGRPTSTTGTLTTTLGMLNPFRYRGYVWDEETELYYLRSRYYNPSWGRFVNADILLGGAGDILSHNIFTYCINDPVAMIDTTGMEPIPATIRRGGGGGGVTAGSGGGRKQQIEVDVVAGATGISIPDLISGVINYFNTSKKRATSRRQVH